MVVLHSYEPCKVEFDQLAQQQWGQRLHNMRKG